MRDFINDCLEYVGNIFNSLPYDLALYGKPENIISAALASIGSINLRNKKNNQYYRTEFKNTDITRGVVIKNNFIVNFICESKYKYGYQLFNTHSLNVNILNEITNKNLFYNTQNVITGRYYTDADISICRAIRQLINYKIKNNFNASGCVLLNYCIFPNGTCRNYKNNSGIKHLTKANVKKEIDFYRGSDLERIPSRIDNMIRFSPIKYNLFPLVECVKKNITPITSHHGFTYYVITLAYSVPSLYP